MDDLIRLSRLLGKRNKIDEKISKLTKRQAQTGMLGEFVAADIFNIQLDDDRSHCQGRRESVPVGRSKTVPPSAAG